MIRRETKETSWRRLDEGKRQRHCADIRMCYLPSFIHVTSPFYSLAVGHASVQLDALVVKASLFDSIASGLQSSDLVNIRVCWDSDRVIRRFKRGESYSRRWCPYGRRPGPPCYPDDRKCQLGCRRGCHAQGKYHVRPAVITYPCSACSPRRPGI